MSKLASTEVLGIMILFALKSAFWKDDFGPGSNYPHFEKWKLPLVQYMQRDQ